MDLPVLDVRTIPLPDSRDLLEFTGARAPIAFLRNGEGIVGVGERLRLEESGEGRVVRLAAAWRELAARARIDDSVGLAGSGLVAFGSIAFAADSAHTSVLVVPSAIVGRRDGITWLTVIDGADAPEPRALGDAPTTSFAPGRTSPEEFRAAVSAATAAIAAGRLEKVVLARDLVGRVAAEADRRAILRRLAERYPDTSVFAVDGLIGASPETLVRVTGGEVAARVLAGTAARSADDDAAAAAALSGSDKNRTEHEFAVRSVLDALAPHATGIERSPEPFALRLPNLWHLATDVRGTLAPGRSVLDIVDALHPTAAVAGTPRDRALELIAQLEPRDRGRYAGPVGWVGASGDGESAIALRCAVIDDDGTVTAWAGAGIVGHSDPEGELTETELKFRPIVEALAPR